MRVNRLALLEKVNAAIARRTARIQAQQEQYSRSQRERLLQQIRWSEERVASTTEELERNRQALAAYDADPVTYVAQHGEYGRRNGGDDLDELKLMLELNTEELVSIPTRSRFGNLYQTLAEYRE